MEYRNFFQIDATPVANEFLEKYMPKANGDYVKVYLCLLKKRSESVDLGSIAEELELTEGDVRRAIRYWEKQGIVSLGTGESVPVKGTESSAEQTAAKETAPAASKASKASKTADASKATEASNAPECSKASEAASGKGRGASRTKTAGSKETLARLENDREFSELLIIVQRYRAKILTEKEVQTMAYLYEELGLPCDVLDYLVQYCVQAGHNNMRYIEKAALDWAGLGIRDLASAKERVREFEGIKTKTARRRSVSEARKGTERSTDYDAMLLNSIIHG